MSTIKQIAQLAGVSRGTVDRVLNNRGSVNPATAAKIREIARALDYTPNRPAKTLAVKKKKLVFGCVLFGESESNPFFGELVDAIRAKAQELAQYGVTVELRHTGINEPGRQAACMEELAGLGAAGLVVTPIQDGMVAEKIRALAERGVPVVTVNSDLPGCGRVAYVGSDSYKSGETAAGMLALVTGGQARVGVVLGSEQVLCHSLRAKGFTRHIARQYPGIQILETVKNNDDDLESYAQIQRMLNNCPEINALFLASAGVKGACRAVLESGRAGEITVISHDQGEYTAQMLREGVIAATLCQQPEVQGALPLDLLLDLLGMDTPPQKEHYYTNIEIKIRENL